MIFASCEKEDPDTGDKTGNSRGTNVASQYRGVYPSVHEGVGGITLNLGENSISWTGSSSGNFPDVSTGSDQAMTWALGGSWAYLYSGNNKIGIVWRYSALGVSTLQNILIGQDKVQLYQHTVLSQMGITSLDVSDIASTVPDIEGEIDSNGSNGNGNGDGDGNGDGNNNPAEIVINKAMIEYEPLGNITADVVKIIVCFDFTDGNKKFRRDTWVSPPGQPTYHTVAVADDIARTYFSYTTLTAELGWADVSNNGTVASNAKHEATHFDRSKYKDVAKKPDALQYVLFCPMKPLPAIPAMFGAREPKAVTYCLRATTILSSKRQFT
ncbi:hypothetical protein AGMMS49574_02080 [Bacteroidia bacterium]|nr:hypothetical protein AGMMS49574_02080 [Bacteroidia bacterium]